MKFLLDTNICIYLLKQSVPALSERLLAEAPDDLAMSAVTLHELATGVEKSQRKAQNRENLAELRKNISVLAFDEEAAEVSGTLRAALEKKGTSIGPFDLLIAAHALSRGLTLVTNNEREFRRVESLAVENWTRPRPAP